MSPAQRGAVFFVAATMLSVAPRRVIAAGEPTTPRTNQPNPAPVDGTPPGPPVDAPPVGPEQKPLRIQYSAHDGCPDALGFFWHVRARTQRVRLASAGELAELATITIEHAEAGSVGTLELPPVDNRPFTRRVEARTCEEVVLALSLVLALAYDPDAITTFPTVVTAPAESPQAPLPAPVLESSPPPPSAAAPAARFGAAAGIAAYAIGGIAPGLSPVLAPFIEYGSNADQLWKPRVMASLVFQIPQQEVRLEDRRTATLLFFGGQLSGCPIWAPIAAGITVAPCLGFDLGQIIGSGNEGVQATRTGSLWWIALEAIGRVRAAVTGPIFAEFVGSGGLTLSRGEFKLLGPPEARVHKVPDGFGSFGLALGVHFR